MFLSSTFFDPKMVNLKLYRGLVHLKILNKDFDLKWFENSKWRKIDYWPQLNLKCTIFSSCKIIQDMTHIKYAFWNRPFSHTFNSHHTSEEKCVEMVKTAVKIEMSCYIKFQREAHESMKYHDFAYKIRLKHKSSVMWVHTLNFWNGPRLCFKPIF